MQMIDNFHFSHANSPKLTIDKIDILQKLGAFHNAPNQRTFINTKPNNLRIKQRLCSNLIFHLFDVII